MRRTTSSVSPVSSAGRRYRLRSLFFFSGMLFLVLLAMSVVFYQSNRAFLLDYIREINARQAQSYARLLDTVFYRASYASAAIADRSRVQEYVSSRESAEAIASSAELAIVELLQLFARANTEISSIYVYAAGADRVVSDRIAAGRDRFHDREWRTLLENVEPTGPVLVYREDPVFGTPMITLLRSMDDDSGLAGGVLVNMEVEHVRRLIGRGTSGSGETVFVVNEDGQVVFSTVDDDLGRAPGADYEPLFLSHASGAMFNLDYYLHSGSQTFDAKMAQLLRHLIVLLVSVVLVGSAVSVVLAGFAYRPIREIVQTIEHPDRHSRHAATDGRTQPEDEISYIEDSIIRMMASNRKLEARLAERFQSLSRAHYAALQLQISPHFLYNTLESIYWNCMEVFSAEDPVPRSVLSLSRFLRTVIATEAIAIPLAEERDITEQYLTLLRLRYEDRLVVRWIIPDALLGVRVPKLLLQPLVENAFYHGIKPLRRPGTITIEARNADGRTEVRVSDDGRGMSAGRLEEVRRLFASATSLPDDHIGLVNVASRIRILFDRAGSVEVDSAEGRGTTVVVTVPGTVPEPQPGTSSDKIVTRM